MIAIDFDRGLPGRRLAAHPRAGRPATNVPSGPALRARADHPETDVEISRVAVRLGGRAATSARCGGDDRARIDEAIGDAYVTSGDPRGLEHVRQARAELDVESQPLEASHAMMIEARYHHVAGELRRVVETYRPAIDIAERAVEEADENNLLAHRIVCREQLIHVLLGHDRHLDAQREARVAFELLVESGSRVTLLMCGARIAEGLLRGGALEVASDVLQRHLDLARAVEDRARMTTP
jgi:hypothetical protein